MAYLTLDSDALQQLRMERLHELEVTAARLQLRIEEADDGVERRSLLNDLSTVLKRTELHTRALSPPDDEGHESEG